jgi:hypothetical protein
LFPFFVVVCFFNNLYYLQQSLESRYSAFSGAAFIAGNAVDGTALTLLDVEPRVDNSALASSFQAHVHVAPCHSGGGGHWQVIEGGAADTSNELWSPLFNTSAAQASYTGTAAALTADVDVRARSVVIHEKLVDGSAPKRFCCDLSAHVEPPPPPPPTTSTTSLSTTTTVVAATTTKTSTIAPTTSTSTSTTTASTTTTTTTPSPSPASEQFLTLLECAPFAPFDDIGDGWSAPGRVRVLADGNRRVFLDVDDLRPLNNGAATTSRLVGHAHVDSCADGAGAHFQAQVGGEVCSQ